MKTLGTVFAGALLFYCSLGTVHAYYHEHVNHACPKNKHNPGASCPGHKPPKDGKTKGASEFGCGCESAWDQLMCFAGY